MHHFELVVGVAVNARSPVDDLGLIAQPTTCAGVDGARPRLTLDREGDLGDDLGVEHDDVEPRLDVGGGRRVEQLRHPLTVRGRRRRSLGRRAAAAADRSRRRRGRRDGASQVHREVTDVRHRCQKYTYNNDQNGTC